MEPHLRYFELEGDRDDFEVDPDFDPDDPDAPEPSEASAILADYLITLKERGKPLTAKDVCLISFYASRAGLTGIASE